MLWIETRGSPIASIWSRAMSKTSKTIKINGECVKALRTKCGFSQKQLAGKVKVDVGNVSRWERGEIDHVRRDTFGKLCMVLNATEAEICGDEPLPENGAAPQAPPKGQMNLSVDTACRNALNLVAMRYGVKPRQIVEAAPLLFFVAAEKSLHERRERLDALRAEVDAGREKRITRATSKFSAEKLDRLREEMEVILDDAEVAERWLDEEKASIEERDLFGSVDGQDFGLLDWENYGSLVCLEDNRFADDLSYMLEAVRPEPEPVRWERGGAPNYRICAEEAAALVGGDQEAVECILSGEVALREMLREVRGSSPAERAKWVLSESQRLAAEAAAFAPPKLDLESI
jgi:transcriptional regulator with XRE-family HTH domain